MAALPGPFRPRRFVQVQDRGETGLIHNKVSSLGTKQTTIAAVANKNKLFALENVIDLHARLKAVHDVVQPVVAAR